MKLYKLPPRQNIKIYCKDINQKPVTIIFDHIDGLYSYCWLEDTKEVVHLNCCTKLRKYKDGYKIVEDRVKE